MVPKKDINGKAIVSIKDYVDKMEINLKADIAKLEETINDKFKARSEVEKHEDEILNERLGRMNEFREQIKEERSQYVNKDMLELKLKPIEKGSLVAAEISKNYNRLLGVLISIIMIVLAMLGYLLSIHIVK